MKTLFIYNPNAGQKQIKNYLYNILNIFAKADYVMTVFPTRKQGETTDYLKKNAKDYDLVVCSGGDGTLNEAINGLMNAKLEKVPTLGYIPAGSTNDYANSIKIPKNMEKAAQLIAEGSPALYDVGKFNSKYFIYIAAFGAFTKVSYNTPQDIKNVLGHLAYLLEGIKSLSEIKAYKMKIKSEDLTIEGKFIYGMVTNTLSVGGIYKLDHKTVKLDDGQFEVMIVREPKDAIEFNEITSFLLGTINKTDLVLTFKTNKVQIETSENVHWTLDGEYGGNPEKIIIKNVPKAINIISK